MQEKSKVMIVVGFLLGIFWGLIDLISYARMNALIAEGNEEDAKWEYGTIKAVTVVAIIIDVIGVTLFLVTKQQMF